MGVLHQMAITVSLLLAQTLGISKVRSERSGEKWVLKKVQHNWNGQVERLC